MNRHGLIPAIAAGLLLAGFALGVTAGIALMSRRHRAASEPPPPPLNTVRVALCQYASIPGDTTGTVAQVTEIVENAFKRGATFVILPELTFHGVRDVRLAQTHAERLDDSEWIAPLSALARRHQGYVVLNLLTRTETNLYNTSVVLDDRGEIAHTHHKTMLANIDRVSRLTPGDEVQFVETRHGRIMVLICRESSVMLNMLSRHEEAVEQDATAAATPPDDIAQEALRAAQDADLVLIQMAFAGLADSRPSDPLISDRLRNTPPRLLQIAHDWASRSGAPVAVVNKTGAEGRYRYVGHSTLVCPAGTIVALAGYLPKVLYVDLPLDAAGRIERGGAPAPAGRFEGWPLPDSGYTAAP